MVIRINGAKLKSRVLSLLLVCVQISNRSIYVRSTYSCTFLMHVTPSYFSPQLWMYAKKLSPSCSTHAVDSYPVNNRPFAGFHSRGTKPAHWDANVALRQDKQRKLPFKIMHAFCWSRSNATFASQ